MTKTKFIDIITYRIKKEKNHEGRCHPRYFIMKPRNFIAKNLWVNRSQVFVDRKKQTKAGVCKHQAMSETYLEHKHMEELYSFDKYRGYCIAIEFLAEGVYEAVVYDAKTHEVRLTSTFHCPKELLKECKLMIDEVLEDE